MKDGDFVANIHNKIVGKISKIEILNGYCIVNVSHDGLLSIDFRKNWEVVVFPSDDQMKSELLDNNWIQTWNENLWISGDWKFANPDFASISTKEAYIEMKKNERIKKNQDTFDTFYSM